MFQWFNARMASDFGTSLAEYLAERIPAESIPVSDKRKQMRLEEIIIKLHSQTASFKKDNKLNIFKKAKLAKAFQSRLLELGYHKGNVEILTTEILSKL
jgi:hypothetical protein